MATRQPRPPWLRFSFLPNTTATPPPPQPQPQPQPPPPRPQVLPAVPIRPVQPWQPATPPPLQRAVVPPTPVVTQPSPPRTTASIPLRQSSPVAPPPTAAPLRSLAPTPESPRTSPVEKPVASAAASEPVNGRTSTSLSSPKIIKPLEKAQTESPTKPRPSSRPPSPLTLPPVQKKQSNSEESGMRMITLAGTNRGAVMESIAIRKNPSNLQKNGEEDVSRNKDKANGESTMQNPATSYFNSNVQGLNNSILYNSSFRHNDPGIHLSVKRANRSSPKIKPTMHKY